MNKALCIYHGNCDDGFGAAYCVALALGNHHGIELYPGIYNKKPPDVAGRDVIMVDFSYKRDVLQEMGKSVRSILILDHHKTAAEDLKGLPTITQKLWYLMYRNLPEGDPPDRMLPVFALFDMERSGAGMAWDFFHLHAPRPLFVDYLEDRDLWKKKLPNGDQFTFALRSYPQTLEAWRGLFGSYTSTTRGRADVDRLITEGFPISRYYRTIVEAAKREAYNGVIDTWHCRVANAPYALASEVAGEIINDDVAFGACFFQRADSQWQYSLRSRKGFDVSEIAKKYGGGGHAAAAGFDVSEPVHRRL